MVRYNKRITRKSDLIVAYEGFLDIATPLRTYQYPLWFEGYKDLMTRKLGLVARNGTEWTCVNEISSRLPRLIDTLLVWSTEWHQTYGSAEFLGLPTPEQTKRIYYQVFASLQYHPKFCFNKHNFFVLLNRMNGALTPDYSCPFLTRSSYGPEPLSK